MQNAYDHHTHSTFSYDASPEATIPRMIETAIANGLAGIAITDHFDPLWPDEDDPSTLDVAAYQLALTQAEQTYGEKIHVLKGIELGLMPGKALELCENVVSSYPYDFVIASIHCSPATPIDYKEFHEGRSVAEVIEEYYTLLYACIKSYKNYDVIGHINGIDRYTKTLAEESLYMPYIDEILKTVIADGKGIEINASAARYGIEQRGTPTEAILNHYKKLGGQTITKGSDAHHPNQILTPKIK